MAANGLGLLIAVGLPIGILMGIANAHKLFGQQSRSGISTGVVAGMTEFDRMVRPSVENVQKAQDEVLEEEETDGD